ncbi:TadE/TadG family type IV pilus assembly protein [Intestinirhabdus alba]|jgi:tight adherence protein G|uniref:Protein TadG, associated with Flp pilus assembly n=1 Tax=Intestinirhabdus alba TaxID=2899544 RepID=A0A6L6ILI5_9ENTR|nr:TadE/TadG family type IV pilus assembly protein [Intestinirhabdus alba]MTH45583.1 protein TadG, associated with Flp pilus assembly [Intestinirhabdus alba]
MSVCQKMLRPWVRFCTDRRGAFAISFVMMSGFLLGMAAFGLEGSRYITERARLSDSMEQAALALTAEDNGPSPRNEELSKAYFAAYMRHATAVATPTVKILHGVSPDNKNLTYVEYRVSDRTEQNSWFSSGLFPGFGKEVTIGDNGAARKYRSNMDVIFVTDFSGSMNESFGGSTKLAELKRIVLQLSDELFSYNIDNKVGFVPFGWGGKEGDSCDFPFASSTVVPPDILAGGDYSNLEHYVDIAGTIAAIPNKVSDIQIPLENVNDSTCLKTSGSHKVPLTDSPAAINQIASMTANGGTLVSSGVLLGVPYLASGTASRKVMVIVSDGTDDPETIRLTPNLINAGMCDKIREVITTKDSVGKISFIGINYNPTFDWKRCVGEKNFYLPQNIKELEDDLRRAVFEEVGHNILKDK